MKDRIISLVLTIIFIFAFVFYFLNNTSDFKTLLSLNPYLLMVVGALQGLGIFVNSFFLIQIVKIFKVNISIKEGATISGITSIGNYFLPFRGGAGMRAWYLKEVHKLPYSKFISTLAGNYIIVFLISSILALIGLTLLLIQGYRVNPVLFLIFTSMFLGLVFLMLFKMPTRILNLKTSFPLLNRFVERISSVIYGWNEIINHKRILLSLCLLQLLNLSINTVLVYVEFYIIGSPIGLIQILVYSSVSSLSMFLSLTPGSLGIRESLLILFQDTLLLTTDEILLTSIIDRGVYFFVMILLVVIFKLLGVRIFKSN